MRRAPDIWRSISRSPNRRSRSSRHAIRRSGCAGCSSIRRISSPRTPGATNPPRAMEGLRLVGALRRSWLVQGLLELGRRVTLEALDRDGAGEPTAARVKALYAAANFSFSLGDYAGARRFAEESLVIARKLGTLETTCDALRVLGVACFALGDMGAA